MSPSPNTHHQQLSRMLLVLSLVLASSGTGAAETEKPCDFTKPSQAQSAAKDDRNAAGKVETDAASAKSNAGKETSLAKAAESLLAAAAEWRLAADASVAAAAAWQKPEDGAAKDKACEAQKASAKAKSGYQEALEKYDAQKPEQVEIEAKKALDNATKKLEEMKDDNAKAEKSKKKAPHPKSVIAAGEVLKVRASEWLSAATAWKKAVNDDKQEQKAKEDAVTSAKKAYDDAAEELVRETDAAAKAKEPEIHTEHLFLHAGLVSLAPFDIKFQKQEDAPKEEPTAEAVDTDAGASVKPALFYLDRSGVAAHAYTELRIRYRQAWDDARLPLAEQRIEEAEDELEQAETLLREQEAKVPGVASLRAQIDQLRDLADESAIRDDLGLEQRRRSQQAELERQLASLELEKSVESGAIRQAAARVDHAKRELAAAEAAPRSDGDVSDGRGWRGFCLRRELDEVGFALPTSATLSQLARCVAQDFDARFGYTFAADADATGSTVVGSGDVNGSVAYGIPLFNGYYSPRVRLRDGTPMRLTTTGDLEMLFEAVTDRGILDIHQRWVVGGSWNVGVLLEPLHIPGLHDDEELRPRVYEMSVRAGWAQSDVPVFCNEKRKTNGVPGCEETQVTLTSDKENGQTRTTIATTRGLPDFRSADGWSLDFDVNLPFGETGYAVMNATMLLGSRLEPNPWSFRLGLTVPFEDLVGVFPRVLGQ